jgi:hypothetical protein
MRSALQDARQGLRVVNGQVSAAGAMTLPGSADWTVTKTATGTYIVRWSPAFRAPPVITATANAFTVLYLVAWAVDNCQINQYVPQSAGTLVDGGFEFHIEGRAA